MRKLKRLLCGLLAMALLAGALPAAHAAGGNVQIGGSALSEGKNSIGGGTATLNTAAGTLVLENVILGGSLSIRSASAFTVIVLGTNSFAPGKDIIALRADTPALAIRLQQGSSLTLSAHGAVRTLYTARRAV